MNWQCDQCGGVNDFAPETRMDGVYEIGYMRCAQCGAEMIAYVSDPGLRASVTRYNTLAKMIRRGNAGERLIRRAQRLKADNVARSKRLREEYTQHGEGV